MKKPFGILTICLAALGLCAAPGEVEMKESVPFTARGGLPNFAAKLKAGEPVTVAYFGGSITEQNGWRVQSADFLRQLYPKSKISPVNAAIGGTGSDLGAFRLAHDVLEHKPDLVFVEFAVNDHGAKPDRIRKAMEGIVRQIRKELPLCDICFVYTVTKANLKDYQAGNLPASASIMEGIAEYYHLPSVNLSYEVAKLEKEGKLVMAASDKGVTRVSGDELDALAKVPRTADGKIVFSGDGVHPYAETGHVIYTNALKAAMPALLEAGKPGAYTPPAPLFAGNWENTAALPLDTPGINLSGDIALLPADNALARQFARRLPKIWKLSAGASIEFKFKGSKVMFYDLLGPDCGILEVTLDGKTSELRRFDAYCTYRRLAIGGIGDNLDPEAVHSVKITATGKPFDKRAILFERNRADFDKDNAKYAPLVNYIGTIFLVGELVR